MLRALFDHDGQHCVITGLIVEPSDEFDEDGLPYFKVRFDDGAELVVGDEELFSNDPRFFELTTAVCGPYAVARDLGCAGPFNLFEVSDPEKLDAFVRGLANFQLTTCAQNFNTHIEFRVPKPKEPVEAASPTYFIAVEVEATSTRPDLVASLQRAFDAGTAGFFQVVPTATPGYMVIFERSLDEDAEFVVQRMTTNRLCVENAVKAQLHAELAECDMGCGDAVTSVLAASGGHCFDFGGRALEAMASMAPAC